MAGADSQIFCEKLLMAGRPRGKARGGLWKGGRGEGPGRNRGGGDFNDRYGLSFRHQGESLKFLGGNVFLKRQHSRLSKAEKKKRLPGRGERDLEERRNYKF